MKSMLGTLRNRGLLTCQVALALVVLAIGGGVGVVAWQVFGLWGLAAAGLAGASCWLGAAIALEATTLLVRRGKGLTGLLVGMAARLGIPLGLALVLHLPGGPLAQAGLLYYFLVFYPLTLAVETALSLPQAGTTRPSANVP